jgi:hypothetical protein
MASKAHEVTNPQSCWNKAGADERIFILLERDESFPAAVRAWAQERIRRGTNNLKDAKIQEALDLAAQVEGYHSRRRQ